MIPIYNGRSINLTSDVYVPTRASRIDTREEFILTNSGRWLPACPVRRYAYLHKGR